MKIPLGLLALSILAVGCGGSDGNETTIARAETGIYIGESEVNASLEVLTPYNATYLSAAEVNSEGRVLLFAVNEEAPSRRFLLARAAGTEREGASQATFTGRSASSLVSNATGSDRRDGAQGARFLHRNSGIEIVAEMRRRSFPTLGTTYGFRDGDYTGRIFLTGQFGQFTGYGIVRGTLKEGKLNVTLNYSSTGRTFDGQFVGDLAGDGSVTTPVLVQGGLLTDIQAKASSDGSRLVVQILDRDFVPTTVAWLELDRG